MTPSSARSRFFAQENCINNKNFVSGKAFLCDELFSFSAPSQHQRNAEERMATEKSSSKVSADMHRNHSIKQEINILLLGVTGVGKSTLINALVNYLANNTLEQAINGRIQVLIPFLFSYFNENTFEEERIAYGKDDEYEQITIIQQTCTKKCRSFVFTIGDRLLRFIDTPSVGDTRGCEQDIQNFDEIINYISRYKYLNGICILLKPNEPLLTVDFRYSVSELLRYLPKSALESIMCVFTNSRQTFFMPGSTRQILKSLLNEHQRNHDIQICFQKMNTFLIDNEGFRCLALHHHGIRLDDEQIQNYTKSWNYTVKELMRLFSYTIDRPNYTVCNIVSLYHVQRLISILAQSIFQMPQHIQRVIQQAEKHKKNISKTLQNLLEHGVQVLPIDPPKLVCTNPKFLDITYVNDSLKIKYKSICYRGFFPTDNANIRACDVMNQETGKVFYIFLTNRVNRIVTTMIFFLIHLS